MGRKRREEREEERGKGEGEREKGEGERGKGKGKEGKKIVTHLPFPTPFLSLLWKMQCSAVVVSASSLHCFSGATRPPLGVLHASLRPDRGQPIKKHLLGRQSVGAY